MAWAPLPILPFFYPKWGSPAISQLGSYRLYNPPVLPKVLMFGTIKAAAETGSGVGGLRFYGVCGVQAASGPRGPNILISSPKMQLPTLRQLRPHRPPPEFRLPLGKQGETEGAGRPPVALQVGKLRQGWEGGGAGGAALPQGSRGWPNLSPPAQLRAVPLFPSLPALALDLMGCNGNKNEAVLMGFLLF